MLLQSKFHVMRMLWFVVLLRMMEMMMVGDATVRMMTATNEIVGFTNGW